MSDLVKRLNKKQTANGVEKDELREVLKYYANLSVVYINEDEQVMFL